MDIGAYSSFVSRQVAVWCGFSLLQDLHVARSTGDKNVSSGWFQQNKGRQVLPGGWEVAKVP